MKKESKFDFVISFVFASLSLITYIVTFSAFFVRLDNNAAFTDVNEASESECEKVTVILDAGHGGEDAGAVSENGILEKDLNLLLCNQIKDILISNNVNVIMTRTEDRLLYTEEQNIKGQRKINDLRNRYFIAKEYENAIFVSVHINKFEQSKYKGLQVWYSPNNEKSATIAKTVQETVSSLLQKENTRKIKKSNGSIYLLDRLECPSILIECGFLSNDEDCKNLSDAEYRKKISYLIAHSIIENIGQ